MLRSSLQACLALGLMSITGCVVQRSSGAMKTPLAWSAAGADSSWPVPNEYSWDGSWTPSSSEFPLSGLVDERYPRLPPGRWDWNEAQGDLANHRSFERRIGRFEPLSDRGSRQFGWNLVTSAAQGASYSGPAAWFQGSSGAELIRLVPGGGLHGFSGDLGDGPDVLVFEKASAVDFRTGSSLTGARRDNDLVIGGCVPNATRSYDITASTIHTGPGRDWVFVRDMERAAIDAGNGQGGNTSAIDPADANDLVVFRGTMRDFRFFGGRGDDVAVWYVDEGLEAGQGWLGPNFFGGGGAGEALWGDAGTDRLVLVVPPDTRITGKGATPAGALMVRIDPDYPQQPDWDRPTLGDPNAKYCIRCGTGPGGRKTVTMEYRSASGHVFTAHFYVTAFEELQLGVGPGARIFRIDDDEGKLVEDRAARPFTPPTPPAAYCGNG